MKLTGIAMRNGVAIGRVLRYEPDNPELGSVPEVCAGTEDQRERYVRAVEAVGSQLKNLVKQSRDEEQEHGDIFYAQIAMLEDKGLNRDVEEAITGRSLCAEAAIREIYAKYEGMLNENPVPLIRERAADLRDIELRLLRCLSGQTHHGLSRLRGPVVVVARDLLPSDTATMDRANVLAIVTEEGSQTSHAGIIARSYGIPAVLGVKDAMTALNEGETVVVDGREGLVMTDLPAEEMEYYRLLRNRLEAKKKAHSGLRCVEPITKDGKRVRVELNMESLTPEVLDARPCVDGVGLFRTEFLYMNRWELPGEEEQYQVYRRVLEAFPGKPVVLRTLDIGGDKHSDCLQLPHEENPFLGCRALRLCLQREEVFLTQLRAILRAAFYGDLRILLPMVSSVEDIRAARAVMETAVKQLEQREKETGRPIPHRRRVPLGVMIEIPSIAMSADLAACEADFASIGTNDLCQYMMAADRKNAAVAPYYRTFHPAMLRLIRHVVTVFHRQFKEVAVCGEMAGDPMGALALLGLGVDTLSMGASSLTEVKRMITSIDLADVTARTEELCLHPLAEDIQNGLQKYMDKHLE